MQKPHLSDAKSDLAVQFILDQIRIYIETKFINGIYLFFHDTRMFKSVSTINNVTDPVSSHSSHHNFFD